MEPIFCRFFSVPFFGFRNLKEFKGFKGFRGFGFKI